MVRKSRFDDTFCYRKNRRFSTFDSAPNIPNATGVLSCRFSSCAQYILALASKKLIQETPSNHSQSLAQYSAALSKHARTLALDIALGDVKKAAELLNDSPKAMDIFAQTRQV